ncbi:hypothetical protein A5647_04955 [Mycobacterium sp. 1100029.7]|nr:hypothetical protein A5647_04955 [Mycobacterium sp. 1100029.7]
MEEPFEPVPGCEGWDETDQNRAVKAGFALYEWPDVPKLRKHNRLQRKRWEAEKAIRRNDLDIGSDAVKSYVRTAFASEITELEQRKFGGRNDKLNDAAFSLGQLVGADVLDEQTTRQALFDACRVNGHLGDDGKAMVLGTIESGIEAGKKQPRCLSNVGTLQHNGFDVYAADLSETERRSSPVQDIEGDFWTSRESLKTIYDAALSRMCSPWAVLGCCAAKALTIVRPHITLPRIIGGIGNLNLFVAIAAESGGGKGAAQDVADELVDYPVYERNVGSGEGLADAYMKPADKATGDPPGRREAVMFLADESDALSALGKRSGATILSTLRSAFSGKTLGNAYRTNQNHIEKNSYRLTFILGVQPERAGWLLDDVGGGTPQRFMWFPANDARVNRVPRTEVSALTLPSELSWQYPKELKIPDIAVDAIQDERVRSQRGEQDANQSHAMYAREKFAFALTVLDGRDEMTDEDWRLSGIAAQVSDRTRKAVTARRDESELAQAMQEGKALGAKRYAADQEQAHQVDKRQRALAKQIAAGLRQAGEKGLTQSEIVRPFNNRDRHMVAATLDKLAASGRIRKIERGPRDRTNRWALTDDDA